MLRTSLPFQAIVMVLESKGEKTFKMVLQLLKSLATSSVITVDQIRRVQFPLMFERCTACVYSLVFRVAFLFFIYVVPPSQGYERVYMDIADINIDVPRAYFILEQFVEKSFNFGIIDVKLRDCCPCR